MNAKTELEKRLYSMLPGSEAQIHAILSEYQVTKKSGDEREEIQKQVDHFLTAKRIDGLSAKTIQEYRYKLRLFAERIKKRVTKITADDIRGYIGFLARERNIKESSIQTHINTLRSFFTWLDMEDIIKKNPMRKIKSTKIDRRSTRHPLTAEQLERLREACCTYREKALLEFLLSSGCRLSEVTGIRTSAVNWLERSVVVRGKGNKERTVYFSVRAKLMLEEYMRRRKGGAALFASSKAPYEPLQQRAIQRILQIIGERAHGEWRIYPHLMRHTFATNALNGGMDITVIQQLLGHADPKTTLIYAELSSQKIQYEYQKIIA